MKQLGTCAKCGKTAVVRDHHIKGYSGENKDTVAPYCQSCDTKAHNKARAEGKCILKSREAHRLSTLSHHRRSYEHIIFDITIAPNILLREMYDINKNTGHITAYSTFRGNNGAQLKTINEGTA